MKKETEQKAKCIVDGQYIDCQVIGIKKNFWGKTRYLVTFNEDIYRDGSFSRRQHGVRWVKEIFPTPTKLNPK